MSFGCSVAKRFSAFHKLWDQPHEGCHILVANSDAHTLAPIDPYRPGARPQHRGDPSQVRPSVPAKPD